MHTFALLMGKANGAKRGTPVNHSQRPCITVMNDGVAVIDQAGAVFSQAEVGAHVSLSQRLGIADDTLHKFAF